jgi:uncharacterized protein YcbX
VLLSALHVYPVKSCRGIAPRSWPLDAHGLRGDRSWMVVDGAGRFLTQRELPRLALIETRIDGERIVLEAPGREPLVLPRAGTAPGDVAIEIWGQRASAVDGGERAARWISAHLGVATRLVAAANDHARAVNRAWFDDGAETAFADGFPLLLISEGSLDDLNTRLAKPLPMDRFRPNLVVRGAAPYEEDLWKRIRIGDVELAIVKPCSRCVITTTEQATGERDGTEPLRTLATYRKTELGVLFGQNAVHLGPGMLATGMPVEVIERRLALRVRPEHD